MKRRPNPYLTTASVLVGALVGWLGYVITNLSCRADQPFPAAGCPFAAGVVGVVGFVIAAVGILVVLGLTGRSIAEYRSEKDKLEGR